MAILGIALLSLGGCATGIRTRTMALPQGLLRLVSNPERISLTAEASGTMSVVDGCFVLLRPAKAPLVIVWPEGTHVTGQGLFLAGGQRLRIGDAVRLGGSSTRILPPGEVETIGEVHCPGPYFIASNVQS